MKSLYDQIVKEHCPKHDLPYSFINKGVGEGNESNLMCDKCQNPQNANRMINIIEAFLFLDGRYKQGNESRLYLTSLWQHLKHYSEQITETIKNVEDMIVHLLQLNDEFLNGLNTQPDVQSLGQYLRNLIDQDSNKVITFKQQQQNQQFGQYEQNCFFQCDQILDGQRKSNDELRSVLSKIQNSIKQNQNINILKQVNLNQLDITNYTYETAQLLNHDEFCNWISLDRSETQLVAALYISLIIYQLTQQGQWIEVQVLSDYHTDHIQQVKFNHNSTLIVSCGVDNLIIIWNKQLNGQWSILDKFNGPDGEVRSICFNHDSSLLASGGGIGTVQIHNINNGKWELQQSLTEHNDCVLDVIFNNDSTQMASGSADYSIIIWKFNNQGKWIIFQTLKEHTSAVTTVQFNEEANQLISSSWDKTIKIWGVDKDYKWKLIHTLIGHSDTVTSAYFNKQSNMIVSGSNDKSIKVWKINQEGQWKCTQTIDQHKSSVTNAIINSDSTMIISSSYDRLIGIHKIK